MLRRLPSARITYDSAAAAAAAASLPSTATNHVTMFTYTAEAPLRDKATADVTDRQINSVWPKK